MSMPAPYLEGWRKQLEHRPYDTDGALIIENALSDVPPDLRGIERRLNDTAQSMLRALHRVAAYWTPERLEREAERRAADDTGPTTIAREAALARVFFHALVEHQASRGYSGDLIEVTVNWRLGDLRAAVDYLDRQAAAVETRAADLRLRADLGELRTLVERVAASEITEAVHRAMAGTGSDERLTQIAAQLAGIMSRLEGVGADVSWIAERTTAEIARELSPPTAAAMLRKLGELATSAAVKEVLVLVARALLAAASGP